MSDLTLAENFPESSHAQWQALTEKGLRGAAFDTLARLTDDGLTRGPLSTADDLPAYIAPLPRNETPLLGGRPWHICAPVRDPEIAHANQQLLEDLEGGASAARINLGEQGVAVKNTNDMKRLLDQVHTDLIPLNFAPNSGNQHTAKLLLGMKDLRAAHVNLGLGAVADEAVLADICAACPDTWRAITLAPVAIHDHGGTEAQELAGMAASIVHAMKLLGPETAHRHMNIELAVDQDGHLNIAKIRAARRIYARIAESFSLSDLAVPIHAITSKRMMQSVDPWTNMLRVMSAGFGAVIGGADYITTRPFTDAIGHATGFGHRIARNMQLMMMEESHLGQVNDAALGSYFHERMTESLAQAAWEAFQHIEQQGGIKPYLQSGDFRLDIDAAIATREADEPPVLGVTLHPAENLREAKVRGDRP